MTGAAPNQRGRIRTDSSRLTSTLLTYAGAEDRSLSGPLASVVLNNIGPGAGSRLRFVAVAHCLLILSAVNTRQYDELMRRLLGLRDQVQCSLTCHRVYAANTCSGTASLISKSADVANTSNVRAIAKFR
jgi:hypothetical protein